MKTLPFAAFFLVALPLGCGAKVEPRQANPNDSSTGGTPPTTGGTGGTGASEDLGGGEGGASAGATGTDPDERLRRCEAICAAEEELPCPRDIADCLQGFCELPIPGLTALECLGHYDALLACLASEPPDSFYCDDDEVPFPKESACVTEQAELTLCIQG
jgi:hypothetical protein